ncbi:MAG: hypothetical protein ACYC8T_14980 [Myxococcaceae bacterium]
MALLAALSASPGPAPATSAEARQWWIDRNFDAVTGRHSRTPVWIACERVDVEPDDDGLLPSPGECHPANGPCVIRSLSLARPPGSFARQVRASLAEFW